MKKLLIIPLLLFASLLHAQVRQLPDRFAYKGNAFDFPVIDLPLDDSATYSATLYRSRLGRALPNGLQPTVTKSAGLLEIRIANTNPLPARVWVEVQGNGQTRFAANLFVDKRPTPPGQLPNEPYTSLWKSLMNYNY